MIKESIILAGGFGTRLQEVVKDVPKPMADINGKPFLEYLLSYLTEQGIKKAIITVGYRHEVIRDYFKNQYNDLSLEYSIEKEPLGTGGGIKKALNLTRNNDVFILNGDTFFNINLKELYQFHTLKTSQLTIALKPMKDFDRYGAVIIDDKNKIIGFREKGFTQSGLINGGIYILNKPFFEQINFPIKFSFEKDFIEKYCRGNNFYGIPFETYFIDIGIPKDYKEAKRFFGI
jgi:D-glycero-alpha-D-manno-heptose 1-phosphate guanylyltransferase